MEKSPREYSFFKYVSMVEYILKNAHGPRIFTKEELRDALKIGEYRLDIMLQDIAMDVEQVNSEFLNYFDETNTWKRPLIKISNEQYYCLDGRMSGYAFYEVMYQIIYNNLGSEFSKKQGPILEQMVYQMFRNKHFSYITGKYKKSGDLPERDCDMILESKDQTMFMEIKKCPLPYSYEQGDDIRVLQALGEGMLYAQEQILWHRVRLKENNVLKLYDAEGNWVLDYTSGNKPIIAVSICMPEYDFLTERHFTETFLESTLHVEYHTIDPSYEYLLNDLNKRVKKVQNAAERLFKGVQYNAKDIFFRSQFRSLQQIWTMLQFCKTKEEFLNMCKRQVYISSGAGDVYVEILNYIQEQ